MQAITAKIKLLALLPTRALVDGVRSLVKVNGHLQDQLIDCLSGSTRPIQVTGENRNWRIKELELRIAQLITRILEARECINKAYHFVDEYTMPQTAEPDRALLEQALKALREAAQILGKAYMEGRGGIQK